MYFVVNVKNKGLNEADIHQQCAEGIRAREGGDQKDDRVLLGRRFLAVFALSTGKQALMIRIRYHRLAQ